VCIVNVTSAAARAEARCAVAPSVAAVAEAAGSAPPSSAAPTATRAAGRRQLRVCERRGGL
jgi:hypothetical protein